MPDVLSLLEALGGVEPVRVLLMAQGRSAEESVIEHLEWRPCVWSMAFATLPACIWTSLEAGGEFEWVISGSPRHLRWSTATV